MTKTLTTTTDYAEFLQSIKSRIRDARISAARTVNRELITLYWSIGKDIVEKQEQLGWGKSVVERLSKDLKEEFPGTEGFSVQNLWRMRLLYLEYLEHPKLAQLVREIPWGQNILILQMVKSNEAREYYLRATIEMGWSRNVLLNQIKAEAYERQQLGPKQHNFEKALPVHLAEQADKAMKDVYMLDFLGIILCADRDHFEIEYALRGIQKPVGVAEYRLTSKLPKTLTGKLPDPKKFRQEIMKELKEWT